MEARVVGGCAALLLAALFACDLPGSRPAAEPSVVTTAASPTAPASTTEVVAAPTPIESAPAESRTAESATEPSSVARASSRVVLVTLDGVRWEDVFAAGNGKSASNVANTMPNLQRLVRDRGIALGGPGCTHDMRASGPNFVSFPGYLEMFTGKAPACTHNACPPVQTDTFIDEARSVASRPGDVAVFSSWSKYAHAVARDRRSIVLSAGAHAVGKAHALGAAKTDPKLRLLFDVGAASSGYPGHGDYRPDEHTARLALRYLELVGPRLLVVGLGDADEHAHRGDIAGYRRAIRRADDFIGELDRTLGRMGDDGKQTAVLVTTDHGRAHSLRAHGAAFPESQRVFVAGFGAGIARRGVTCASEPLRLSHVAGAVRSLLALEGEVGPLAVELDEGAKRTTSPW